MVQDGRELHFVGGVNTLMFTSVAVGAASIGPASREAMTDLSSQKTNDTHLAAAFAAFSAGAGIEIRVRQDQVMLMFPGNDVGVIDGILGKRTRLSIGEVEVEVEVPAGKTNIEAMKGWEYRPHSVAVDVIAGKVQTATIRLERLIDLPARSWYSGDTHVHDLHQGNFGLAHQTFFDQLLGEDLHITNALQRAPHRSEPVGARQADSGARWRLGCCPRDRAGPSIRVG